MQRGRLWRRERLIVLAALLIVQLLAGSSTCFALRASSVTGMLQFGSSLRAGCFRTRFAPGLVRAISQSAVSAAKSDWRNSSAAVGKGSSKDWLDDFFSSDLPRNGLRSGDAGSRPMQSSSSSSSSSSRGGGGGTEDRKIGRRESNDNEWRKSSRSSKPAFKRHSDDSPRLEKRKPRDGKKTNSRRPAPSFVQSLSESDLDKQGNDDGDLPRSEIDYDDSDEEDEEVDDTPLADRLAMARDLALARSVADPQSIGGDNNTPKGWVSMQLSDAEADEFNQQLGIKGEVDQAEKQVKAEDSKPASSRRSGKLHLPALSREDEEVSLRSLRGFLQLNPFICSGCGTAFQSRTGVAPGYLLPEKFKEHHAQAELIRSQQEAIKTLRMADIGLDSPTAEQFLRLANASEAVIRGVKLIGRKLKALASASASASSSSSAGHPVVPYWESVEHASPTFEEVFALQGQQLEPISSRLENGARSPVEQEDSVPPTAGQPFPGKPASLQLGGEEDEALENDARAGEGEASQQDDILEPKLCICQRCFRLQQYGKVENSLRPGWSEHELLTPQRFHDLLNGIKKMKTVVLSIVDVFDLEGSIVSNLKAIAGDNPVIIAVNKADLLPSDASESRLRDYLYHELRSKCHFFSRDEYRERFRDRISHGHGVLSRGDIFFISCQRGSGLQSLLSTIMPLAKEHGNSIHVLGAANSGKSSFINHLLDPSAKASSLSGGPHKKKASHRRKTPLVTVSSLPGTTLDFLKIKLPNGVTVVDTPGLIQKGHVTTRLTPDELKQVLPAKPIQPATVRVIEGKTVLLGGLARVTLTQGRPMFFTVFAASTVKLHYSDELKAESYLERHTGELVAPPASPQRWKEIGPFKTTTFELSGSGWGQANTDIVIPGVGWVAITGPGNSTVSVTAPEGTEVTIRPSLLPFEARSSLVKFTGGRMVQKGGKP